MENKTTSPAIAAIASRAMRNDELTPFEIRQLAASALSQAPSKLSIAQREAVIELVDAQGIIEGTLKQLTGDESALQVDRRLLAIAATEFEKGFCIAFKAIEQSLDLNDESETS